MQANVDLKYRSPTFRSNVNLNHEETKNLSKQLKYADKMIGMHVRSIKFRPQDSMSNILNHGVSDETIDRSNRSRSKSVTTLS